MGLAFMRMVRADGWKLVRHHMSKGGNELVDCDKALGYEYPKLESSYTDPRLSFILHVTALAVRLHVRAKRAAVDVVVEARDGEVTQDDYDEVVDQIRKLYNKANLVHADLSEYNIFKNTKGEVMLLDFGSAVDVRHPNSKQFLVRDIQNVNRFFAKRGIEVLDMDKFVEGIST